MSARLRAGVFGDPMTLWKQPIAAVVQRGARRSGTGVSGVGLQGIGDGWAMSTRLSELSYTGESAERKCAGGWGGDLQRNRNLHKKSTQKIQIQNLNFLKAACENDWQFWSVLSEAM